jgi:hypothetical protein
MGFAFTVSTDVLRGVEFSDISSINTDDFLLALCSAILFSNLSTFASSVAT